MVAKGRPEFVSHFLVQYLLFRNKGQFMAVLFPSNFYFYSHRKANEIDWLGVELLILFVNLVYLHGHVFFCRSLFSVGAKCWDRGTQFYRTLSVLVACQHNCTGERKICQVGKKSCALRVQLCAQYWQLQQHKEVSKQILHDALQMWSLTWTDYTTFLNKYTEKCWI